MSSTDQHSKIYISSIVMAHTMAAVRMSIANKEIASNAVDSAEVLLAELEARKMRLEEDDSVEITVTHHLDGRTLEATISDCNILKLTVQHNGTKGGDSGHGGFTSITLEDQASTDMEVNGRETSKVNIRFGGDAERRTLIQALKIIVKELEENTQIGPF